MNITALLTGFAVNVTTLSMHAGAAMLMLPWFRRRVEKTYSSGRRLISVAFMSLAISGLLTLQLISSFIWAALYNLVHVTANMREAEYLALTAISALGGDDSGKMSAWRVLLPLTAINGALLFGLSTAVMFRLVSAVHSLERANQKT